MIRRGPRALVVSIRLGIIVMLTSMWGHMVLAAEWEIGAATGTRPVLSLAMSPKHDILYHVTSHLSDERVVLTGDMQRRTVPAFGYGNGWRLNLYGGVGAEGASERQGDGKESYRLRLPVG